MGCKITYTMMLLMGMWISLTKNPMKPMMQKPMAVAMAIFWNSAEYKTKKTKFCMVPQNIYYDGQKTDNGD